MSGVSPGGGAYVPNGCDRPRLQRGALSAQVCGQHPGADLSGFHAVFDRRRFHRRRRRNLRRIRRNGRQGPGNPPGKPGPLRRPEPGPGGLLQRIRDLHRLRRLCGGAVSGTPLADGGRGGYGPQRHGGGGGGRRRNSGLSGGRAGPLGGVQRGRFPVYAGRGAPAAVCLGKAVPPGPVSGNSLSGGGAV